MIFGGDTLRDFGFALLVGVASGTYSSIFIAAPVLTEWKEREPIYRRRRAHIAAENGGVVPAVATGPANVVVDVDKGRRLRGGARLTAPDDPEQKVSRTEFDEMVRDLHADPAPKPSRPRTAVADPPVPKANAKPAPPKPTPTPPKDDGADALPEDVVMPDRPDAGSKPKPRGAASRRKGKHGRPR
jgi:SecD/SecF fusion protein